MNVKKNQSISKAMPAVATYFPWSTTIPKQIPAPPHFVNDFPNVSVTPSAGDNFFEVEPPGDAVVGQSAFFEPVITTGAK